MRITNSKHRIKDLMNMLGLKQIDICNKSGIQSSALSNYLNGTREPRMDAIIAICDAYNINPSWLIGYKAPVYQNEVYMNEQEDSARTLAYLKQIRMDKNELRLLRIAITSYCRHILEDKIPSGDVQNVANYIIDFVEQTMNFYLMGLQVGTGKAELDSLQSEYDAKQIESLAEERDMYKKQLQEIKKMLGMPSNEEKENPT